MKIFIRSFEHALIVTTFVFIMMMLVDYLNLITRGKLNLFIKKEGKNQYFLSSFLGATPGCVGTFLNVSFYMRGLISFGAIVGSMIATCGDEAFVMLVMIPKTAILLFFLLFVLGVVFGWLVDIIIPHIKIEQCEECKILDLHEVETCRRLRLREVLASLRELSLVRFLFIFLFLVFIMGSLMGNLGPKEGWEKITFVVLLFIGLYIILTTHEHYLEEHVWEHIAKRHLWRVFLWTFSALLIVEVLMKWIDLEVFISNHMFWILLISALIGIIPESGPHLVFVIMFSKGLIPFSVLLTSSIVQDGHGMLPLFSYSVKNSVQIKLINLIIGLLVGLPLYLLGL